ncbi:MAG: linear amide C-N hydrolase [Bacteroidales bacterium]|nr:linear amide C-N hydrolase [Bacteroidales bacterium]
MLALFGIAAITTAFILSCSDDETPSPTPTPTPAPTPGATTKNPACFLKDKEKLATIYTMKDLDGTGRLYEVNYTADYKLDEALDANISSTMGLLGFVQHNLFDSVPEPPTNSTLSFLPGCSAFTVPDPQGNSYQMGRNYDFLHRVKISGTDQYTYVPISAFVVRTAPAGKKKSISFVDGLNFGYNQGACNNDTTDLSLLIGLPYAALDGINEDGFAIGVLSLNEAPTMQDNPTKKNINTTVAIRLLLDNASTVDEAIALLDQYNMRMFNTDDKHNYHYLMADAKGDFAIVEYTRNPSEQFPTRMEVLRHNDTLRCVTNFYVSPTMAGTNDGWGSDHGKTRYWDLRSTLQNHNYALTPEGAMSLLSLVSQERKDNDPTSFTQWSALYNLTNKSVRLALLRDYSKFFDFKVE